MKRKLRKILLSCQLFFMGLASKVFAITTYDIQTDYGIQIQPEYGIENPIEKGLKIGRIVFLVILFIIGLFVILSKKITKKVKAIVISILILLAIAGYAFMNYIATNF